MSDDTATEVGALARELVRIDSRSSLSNRPVAEAIEAHLPGFTFERIDYTDPAGVAKRCLVGRRGTGTGGLAFSGHMDTVPDTGWHDDPWSGRIAEGVLHGLGSADMKGPLAAVIWAARHLPARVPLTVAFTADEETTNQGASEVAARSQLLREARPAGMVITEPTRMVPVRGHRSYYLFRVGAAGVQAHSSTGRGRNANWALPEFLAEMRALHEKLRADPALQDAAYDPPFTDLNPVIDNFGTADNVTVPRAEVRMSYRYSQRIDPAPVVAAVRAAAERHGLSFTEEHDGPPPELAVDHPLVARCVAATGTPATTAPFATDAPELATLVPCVIMGPGDIGLAHAPGEHVPLAELAHGAEVFARLACEMAEA